VSDTIVRFEFKQIYVPGFDALATQSIVAKHIWDTIDDPVKYSNPNPVGTGPFTEIIRFDSQLWELGKNPNYWQKGKPQINKLIFPTYPSNEQVTLALLSGNLDWAGAFIPAVDRVFVSKDTEHHKYWFPLTGHTTFLHTNTKDPILSDVRVRKAISYAIDRELVVKVGMYQYTEPAHVSGVSGPMSKWHSPYLNQAENWTVYDPVKANILLDNANFIKDETGQRYTQDGHPLEFDIIIVSGWSDWIRSAQVVSQNLKNVGIKAKVKTYDFGAWISRMQKGEFELAIGWAEKGPTPYALYRGMMSSEYLQPKGETADVNWHRFGLAAADSLFRKYERTSNQNEITEIIYELQHLFIEHAPSLPLFAEASWAECNTKYFTNFPSKENPYATLSPNYPPENLLVLVNLKRR
jgi:peptide/nickel transport system substrate-binding protein